MEKEEKKQFLEELSRKSEYKELDLHIFNSHHAEIGEYHITSLVDRAKSSELGHFCI